MQTQLRKIYKNFVIFDPGVGVINLSVRQTRVPDGYRRAVAGRRYRMKSAGELAGRLVTDEDLTWHSCISLSWYLF